MYLLLLFIKIHSDETGGLLTSPDARLQQGKNESWLCLVPSLVQSLIRYIYRLLAAVRCIQFRYITFFFISFTFFSSFIYYLLTFFFLFMIVSFFFSSLATLSLIVIYYNPHSVFFFFLSNSLLLFFIRSPVQPSINSCLIIRL